VPADDQSSLSQVFGQPPWTVLLINFEGDFEIVDDFLGEYVGIGKATRFIDAFVFEPERVEARKRPPLSPSEY
jgi:hypothetical protein